MSEEKPDWYKRARKGPFDPPLFDQKKQNQIHNKVSKRFQPRNRKKWLIVSGLLAGSVMIFFLMNLIPSFNIITPGQSKTGQHETETIPAVVRAEGISESGKLQIVALDEESQDMLGAPSCMGIESDLQMKSNYQVIFIYENGKRTKVAELPDLTFIQPNTETQQLATLELAEVELFLLVPQYKDCHALTFYTYALDRSSLSVFPVSYQLTDGTIADTMAYPPGQAPRVVDNQFILPSSEGPGGEQADGPKNLVFRMDLTTYMMVQEEHR